MNKYLSLAVEQAAKSRCNQRHGAVVVWRGRVLAQGCNVQRFTPDIDSTDWRMSAVHAEEVVLSKLGGRVPRGSKLYVARINYNDEVMLSAPCKRCWGAIKRSGITSVAWT